MITPQFTIPLHHELVIDLFAGGGGASTGIEQTIGRPVDIAINHDPEAVALHQANHPQTLHFVSDVFEVDPLAVCDGRPVGLLHASPDCKHFSKAKGGKPVSKKIRSLAWVVVKWAKLVRPRVITLENVEEFQTWGPLTADNMPCPQRRGRTFRRWKRSLEQLGYVVDHRELRACDFGAPTIRKRLFLVARCDGQPIVWPEPTHAAPGSLAVKARKAKPWRTAAECIDWTIPCPSIFERGRPLADATCRRVAKGIVRYVIEAGGRPFIVPTTHQGGDRVESVDEPARTVTGAQRGERALVVPTLINMGHGERPGQQPRVPGVERPHSTITAQGQHSALVTAFLAKHYGGVVGSDVEHPIGTVTSVDHHSVVTAHMVTIDNQSSTGGHAPIEEPLKTTVTENRHALVAAHLVHMGHGEQSADGAKRWSHGVRDVDAPLNTVTASGMPAAVVTSNLVKLRGTSKGAQGVDEPLHTVSAQGMHHAEVRAFLIKYYGTVIDGVSCDEPLHTVTARHRFGLVTVHGEQYQIVDIGLRMLTPRELYNAQGFPPDYRIDKGGDGKPLTKTAQVRMCGNSVCPPLERAIVAANYREWMGERAAA